MNREDQIKKAWADYPHSWPRQNGAPLPFLKITNHSPAPTSMWEAPPDAMAAPSPDVFVFEREDGTQAGKPSTRIVCEGVVVAIWPR